MHSSRANWDLDLKFGQSKENLVEHILSNSEDSFSVEVKADEKLSKTGNVAIEYSCNGHPSGINVTKADYWAFVAAGDGFDSEVIVMIKTDRLKRVARKFWKTRRPGGDDERSWMVLVPFHALISKED